MSRDQSVSRPLGWAFLAAALLAVMLPARATAQGQPATISGRVLNQAGNPLVYVNVLIPALGAGAITKENGTYTITIPGARVSGQTVTMIARALGYKARQAQ